MKTKFLASCVFLTSIFAAHVFAQTDAVSQEMEQPVAETQPAPQAIEQTAPEVTEQTPSEATEQNNEQQTVQQESTENQTEVASPEPQTETQVDSTVQEQAPVQDTVAIADSTQSNPDSVTNSDEFSEKGFISANTEPEKPKKKRKKKKMIDKALYETQKLSFDVMADFELEAGKVFWNSEDDSEGDNLETWNGEANFAILAEGDDFKGKLGIAFYPGDLSKSVDDYETKRQKRENIREDKYKEISDYFSIDEAWAYQETEHLNFKVGRWDNTDKNGDQFGGYIDGYISGFMSTQPSENQLQFGFTPTENMEMYISLISTAPHLNKGDLRAAFNFHGLEGLSELNVQLAYRSNLFDVVYDSDAKIKHNASLKANLPVIRKHMNIFAEAALMDIEDVVIPLTGGIAFFTPVVDRIILEAEYIGDRQEHPEFQAFASKHVKDVLGAIYLEKAFTDRFSLSAGFHSYGSTKDFMLSGNLVGRIN